MPPSPANLRTLEPNELVRRAHDGCADSFTELSRRFRPRVLHLVQRRLGRRHADAEDIAQEALAKAFQGLDRFDDRFQFSTWLYTIAVRVAYDHARSDRRRLGRVALAATADATIDSAPEQAVEHAEQADNIWRLAKETLSPEQYTAMWLRYGEDLPPAEVAQVMGRSRIAVRVMLHRARTALVAKVTQ
ncbi:MAG: sigma-70 family RNA polymerase sigma factor [Pirellulales bacterium]|nr:sigma-70 family RNA polymerase sigma factor [Pirellulales bacterium]